MVIDLHNKQWLIWSFDLHLVCFLEVVSNVNLFPLWSVKGISCWCLVKDDISYNVSLLISPITNDRFKLELLKDFGFLILNVVISVNFLDSLKAIFVGEKFVDIINDYCHA